MEQDDTNLVIPYLLNKKERIPAGRLILLFTCRLADLGIAQWYNGKGTPALLS